MICNGYSNGFHNNSIYCCLFGFAIGLDYQEVKAWALISGAIFLMALRRCFTLAEWFQREFILHPVDLTTEIVGFFTSVFMLLGVAWIAPLFLQIKRSKAELREKVEERTVQLKNCGSGSADRVGRTGIY